MPLTPQKREELSKLIHMEALSKSSSSNKLGELTVVPIGYVSQIALKFIDQLLIEKQEKITERQKLFDFIPVDKHGYKMVKASDLNIINILKE